MGWWTVRKDTREVYTPVDDSAPLADSELLDISDDCLDVVDAAMSKVLRIYKRDLKRKPTPDELSELLQSSIRTIEHKLFDNMDERELESVTITLKQRPRRPKIKPGDIFAIPLPSGGFGYGRVMKVRLKTLLWMQLLDIRSDHLLQLEQMQDLVVVLDLHTGTSEIDNVQWPIIGHIPFSEEDKAALENEPYWITGYTTSSIVEIAEWKLSGNRGLPPDMSAPFVGYRGT